MNNNNNKGFEYAYTPQLIEPKYKYLADWMYKQMKGEFKNIRAGEEVLNKGKYERQWNSRTKYFTASMDVNGFYCYEMEASAAELENEPLPHTRYNHVSEDCPPELDIPEYPENDEDEEKQLLIWSTAMQTAIVQLHQEGEFAGVVASYPCIIRLCHDNNVYSMGCEGELFLTINSKDGETPLKENMPALVPDELLCKDYYNDEVYNYVYSYELTGNKVLKIDGNTLQKVDAGKLQIDNGQISASTLFDGGSKEPFGQIVAPGEYVFKKYIDKNKNTALTALFFEENKERSWHIEKAIRWEPAKTSSGNDDNIYSSYFGYNDKNEIIVLVTDYKIINTPQPEPVVVNNIDDAYADIDNTDVKPFLYFGAGHVSDYYKLKFYIKFKQTPTEEELQDILYEVPQPIDARWCEDESDILKIPGIKDIYNSDVQNCYGSVDDKVDKEQCSKQAMCAFEKAVNKWLLKVHETYPIHYVISHKGNEPDKKIKLSSWHKQSIKKLPELLESLSDVVYEDKSRQKLLSNEISILLKYAKMAKMDIGEKFIKISPDVYIYDLLKKGNAAELEKGLQTYDSNSFGKIDDALSKYFDKYKTFNQYNNAAVYELGKVIIDFILNFSIPYEKEYMKDRIEKDYMGTVFSFYYNEMIPKLIFIAVAKNDSATLKKLNDIFSQTICGNKKHLISNIHSMLIVDLIKNKHWQLALQLYEYTFGLIDQLTDQFPWAFDETSIYCNALYACLKSNNGLTVDFDRNKRILLEALRHTENNKTIFYNAACVYVEMQEYDKALDCMKKYFGCDHPYYKNEQAKLRIELKKDKAFDEFRKQKEVAEYLDE